MKKSSSQPSRFNRKALFVLLSILLSAVSVQGQAILSGDRSVPLEAMGHTVNEKASMGAIQSIMIAEDGTMFGGADPRRSTSAAMGF